VAVSAAPFVAPSIPVATDLPKHLFVARVYADYHRPEFRFPEYFELTPRPVPTSLVTLLLASTVRVVEPYTAGKLFFAACAAGLWYFTRGWLRALGKPPWGAIVVLPLTNCAFAFSGTLGFYASLCCFPALLWVLTAKKPGATRVVLLSAVLIVLYGFHLVAWGIGCFAVALDVFAGKVGWRDCEGRNARAGWADLLAPLASAPLLLLFAASESRYGGGVWNGVFGQIKGLFAYTALATTRASAIPLLIGMTALIAAALWSTRSSRPDRPILALGLVLMAFGAVLPQHYGAFSPMGPRVMPFALVVLSGAMALTERGWRRAAAFSAAITVPLAVLNLTAVRQQQPIYREFMAGISSVAYGSRILPVIEGWEGGWALNPPIGKIEDTYNLARGGSNPLAYVYPQLGTGAYLLKFRQAQPDTSYRWKPGSPPPLAGASKVTDYVVLFGYPRLREPLAAELDLCYSGGRLAVFGRRGLCVK
jgi:hypothetical protein